MTEHFHRFDISMVSLADLEFANDVYLSTQIAQNTDLGVPKEERDSEWFVTHQFRKGMMQGLELAFGQSLRSPEEQSKMVNDVNSPRVGDMLHLSEYQTPMQRSMADIVEEAKRSIEKEQDEERTQPSPETSTTEENREEKNEASE